jgi:hypothetical protein
MNDIEMDGETVVFYGRTKAVVYNLGYAYPRGYVKSYQQVITTLINN